MSRPSLWIWWITVCESELGHERVGVVLVDSIAADSNAPSPKVGGGVCRLSPSRWPLLVRATGLTYFTYWLLDLLRARRRRRHVASMSHGDAGSKKESLKQKGEVSWHPSNTGTH